MDYSKTEHPNTEHENVRYLNGFGFRAFRIRAPSVEDFLKFGIQIIRYSDARFILLTRQENSEQIVH